jgi:hypothetical protein
MTDAEKLEILKECFSNISWMAIRYAHGRSSYAPEMVRDAIHSFQSVFPDWTPMPDATLSQPPEGILAPYIVDYLNDIVSEE